MKIKKCNFFFIFLLCIQTSFCINHLQASYAFFDMDGNEKQRFAWHALEQTGLPITYVPLTQLIDEPDLIEAFGSYQGVFFLVSNLFLHGLTHNSPLSNKILSFMNHYCKKPHSLNAFFFPSFFTKKTSPITHEKPLSFVLNSLGIDLALTQTTNPRNYFWYLVNKFLTTPLETRKRSYHTTLCEPKPKGKLFFEDKNQIQTNNHKFFPQCLPTQHHNYQEEIQPTFPYGIYWYSPLQTHIFISSTTVLGAAGIEENFHFLPTDVTLRYHLNQAICATFSELASFIHNKHTPTLHSEQKQETQTSLLVSPIQKTAWMELVIFEQEKDTQKQKRLIDHIYQAGLDTLWISITPNVFYSPIARQKNKEYVSVNAFTRFTQMLREGSQEHTQPLPQILIGFEIANNLYEPNLPLPHAVDLYGNDYPDLPTPLSQTFWKQEIKKPLNIFLKKWKTATDNFPISGIVLDLEMYCRKKSNLFLATMGFDQVTFDKFAHKHSFEKIPKTPHKKIKMLMKHKQAKNYFDFLEQEAQILGNNLRTFFTKKIPNCLITCYAPMLLTNWFYKGFWKGLSSKECPLHLFTFNTEFSRHHTWLTLNEIYAHHSSVLLLSKIQKTEDFSWVDNILKNHHGIWLNRFSRLVEDYNPLSWTHVEQTPLKLKKKIQFLKHLKNR